MRRIANAIGSIKSLGVLGLILLVIVVVIVWSGLGVIRLAAPLENIYGQTQKRELIADMEFYLLEQEILEQYFVVYFGEDQFVLESYAEAGDALDDLVYPLETEQELWISSQETALLEQWDQNQQAYRQTFAELEVAITDGDWEQVEQLQRTSFTQTALMHKQIDDLLFESESALNQAIEQAVQTATESIVTGTIGLILLPILAVWAFLVASNITQPLLALSNAVTAIAGDQFRSDLLLDVSERPDGLGRLAQSVEHLAQLVHDREVALGQKISILREQLYETKRRRRLPTSVKRESHFGGTER